MLITRLLPLLFLTYQSMASAGSCEWERDLAAQNPNNVQLAETLQKCETDALDAANFNAKIAKKLAADNKKEADRIAKLAADKEKKGGVVIGMTTAQALASSWGKPNHVNRTTTSSGVREQWVYGGRNYLYFTNGTLTAIQN